MKRSDHIPTFTASATNQRIQTLRRTRRLQRSCGTTQLQAIAAQNAIEDAFVGRATNCWKRSYGSPDHQAKNQSVAYEKRTIQPVTSVIFARLSRCRLVITSWSPKIRR